MRFWIFYVSYVQSRTMDFVPMKGAKKGDTNQPYQILKITQNLLTGF